MWGLRLITLILLLLSCLGGDSMGALWTPQEGPQSYASVCPCDEIFFGGTRGGGKSDCAIGRQINGAEEWGDKWNGLMIRRKYKDFAEIRRRIDELITQGMPAERTGGENQTNYVKFYAGPAKGARITLAAIKELKQIDDFQGHQYTEVTIDEAPSFPFIAQLIDKLRGCLRSPHGVPCHIFMTGNPGGPGANSVKMLYIKKATPNTPFKSGDNTAIFVPSSLADNKILCANDPAYVKRLQSIKDPALRAAWLLGDWDAFIGQAFDFAREYHVVRPMSIPKGAPLYMTYDFGFGAPFSVGWWWVDSDNRLYRFAEWYGWDGETPNVGMRWEDSRVGRGILEREKRLGLEGRNIIRLASHDCWNKKPDYKGGGQGPSTSEVWAGLGIYLIKADPSRGLKIRQFRERMHVNYLNLPEVARRLGLKEYDDKIEGQVWLDTSGNIVWERKLLEMARMNAMQLQWERPMLQVYDTCTHFIRTIPDLCVDENNVEDIDTDQEDHIYDEACQICMARPISPKTAAPRKLQSDRHIEATERPIADEHELAALQDQRIDNIFWEQYAQQEFYGDDYDQPSMRGGYSDVDGR